MPSSNLVMYIALSSSAFLNGWFLSSYGPLIPYYAQITSQDQTHYSYFMMCRSLGIVFGLLAAKYLPTHFSTRILIVYAALVSALGFYCTTLSYDDTALAAAFLLTSSHTLLNNALSIGATFQLYPQQSAFYQQMRAFIHGLGALLGPLIVSALELNTYRLLALCQLPPLLVYLTHPIPNVQTSKQAALASKPTISSRTELYICLIMLFYAGQSNGLASWLPTYAIKAGVSDVEGSGFYSFLMWAPTCFCRLVWIYVPGRMLLKLKWCLRVFLVGIFFCLFLQIGEQYNLVCVLAPLTTALTMSNIYPFCISLPSDSGFQPTSDNTAHFMLANSLGEGLINTPIGVAMRLLSFRALILSVAVVSAASVGVMYPLGAALGRDYEQGTKRKLLLREEEMVEVK